MNRYNGSVMPTKVKQKLQQHIGCQTWKQVQHNQEFISAPTVADAKEIRGYFLAMKSRDEF
jgi:hypothetical protein